MFLRFWHFFSQGVSRRYFRINVVLFFIALFAVIVQIKLFTLFHFNKQQKNNNNKENINLFDVDRLDIIDRNGILLARNIMAYDFYIYPYRVLNIEDNLNKIIQVLPNLANKKEKLMEIMTEKAKEGKGAVLVKQAIFPTDKQRILSQGVLGVEFQESQRRIYPHGSVASHILGFLSVDGDGMMGIERYFDTYLKNTANKKPIQLSIDINIQNVTRYILNEAMKKAQAKAAIAIIINVKTGELVSAVSLPDFNPNNLKNHSNNDLFNRFSLGVYELGSVMKVLTVPLAIENGISPIKEYDTQTPFVVGDFVIHNFSADRVRATMNMVEILKHSSNIGIARIIAEIGNYHKQKEMFEKLGLLDKLDIELLEVGRPIYQDRWKLTQAITRGYGHGIAVSPLSFAYAFSSTINNGEVVKPTLLKIPEDHQNYGLPNRVISEKSSKKVRDILRLVVAEGTGRQSAAEKYDVGGKTGTAIKTASKKENRIKNLAYSKFKNLVSFIAAVPMKDPEYVYYLLLDEPFADNNNVLRVSGGRLVAPAMGELISITGPMLNIPMEK